MANEKLSKYIDFFLYTFFAVGIVVFVVKQLNKSETKSFDTYPKTEIEFKFDTLINFGKVEPLKTIEFKGFIKNIGQNKLYIGNLKTSCGCTNFSVANSVVNPRDSTIMLFSIKTIEKGSDIVSLNFEANTKKVNYKLRAIYEAVK